MAELDIKDIWKKGARSLENAEELDVDKVIGKKSKTVLAKIHFILSIEFWLNNILMPFILYFQIMERNWGKAAFVLLVFIVYLLYYLFLMRQTKQFDYSRNVKESLSKVYGYLRFYLLHYKVVMFLSVFYGGGVGYYEAMTEAGPVNFGKEELWPIIMLTAALVLVYLLFRFLINLIYGRKVKRLRQMISEFN